MLYLDLEGSTIEKNCGRVIATNYTRLEDQIRRTLKEYVAKNCKYSYANSLDVDDEFRDVLVKNEEEKKKRTVVLIDEYDFSILNNMVSCPIAAELNKAIVRDILLVLKHYGSNIKFAFVTGISKSVVTTLGSQFAYRDITHDLDFHDIAGLTKSDLPNNYGDNIAKVCKLSLIHI